MPASFSNAEAERAPALAHGPIALLGIVTIAVYGTWYYAFGVLLDPIIADTGWSETMLAGAFSVGIFGIGAGSLFGGRLLDRLDTRRVFAIAALVGGGALAMASYASNVWVFVGLSALGMAALGALGFYHVTMTAVVRLHPEESARAIAALTIWGALASPLYLPLTAWLVEGQGWRVTVRLLVGSAVVALCVAAVLVPIPTRQGSAAAPISIAEVARSAIATPASRSFTLAVALIGVSISVILAYQVPVMLAAGLPLTTAATMAGVRGFSQLGGRIPLGFLVARIGPRQSLLVALSLIAIGTVVLAFSGRVIVALAFAVLAGLGIGAYSPLQGMYSAELFDREALGSSMGMYTSVSMLAGSIGPVLAGGIAQLTGDRRWVAGLASMCAVAAVVVLARGSRVARIQGHREVH
ncbi:MAG: MFS family permease [Acidimicrobiales bacterium]|jgi:MFS family permease